MTFRSQNIVAEAPQRALLKGIGVTDEEMKQPFIGIANSWSELSPGHIHLREISDYVKRGVRYNGATPLEFNTISVCDGLSGAYVKQKQAQSYTLPTRQIVADSIEIAIEANQLDAMVLIGTCDKIVPGMLLAIARLNIPSIFVFGGSMLAGQYKGLKICGGSTELIEATGRYKEGKLSDEELDGIIENACPTPGACGSMVTANSMGMIMEALGLSLPGTGTIPARDMRQLRKAELAGSLIVDLLKANIKPLDIINEKSLKNAIRIMAATGGSTNTVLHLAALANELDLNINIFEMINDLNKKTPHLCSIKPSGEYSVPEFHEAGGLPALMNEMKTLMQMDLMTITQKSMGENIEGHYKPDDKIIKDLNKPFKKEGGIAVLHGNLAPEGAVVKQSAVADNMKKHRGPAKVYNSEEEAVKAIEDKSVVENDIVVIRYEGPKGGPGMREMTTAIGAIWGRDLASSVSLISDGRFSGAIRGPAVGYISPEAAEGSLLALVKNGDIINIDIGKRKLEVELSDKEIKKRKSTWEKPSSKISKHSYLKLYEQFATSASKGAILKFHD